MRSAHNLLGASILAIALLAVWPAIPFAADLIGWPASGFAGLIDSAEASAWD